MKNFLLFLIVIVSNNVYAQDKSNAYIDSLVVLLSTTKQDSDKIILLHKIGVGYRSFDLVNTRKFAEQGLALSQKINWAKGIVKCKHLIGSVYMNNGIYDTAINYFLISYDLAKKIKFEHGQVAALLNLGLTEVTRGDGIKAMDYLTTAIPIAERVKDTGYLALVYNNISNVHFFNKNYTSAKTYTAKALNLARLGKNDEATGSALSTMGTIYHVQNDTVNAMKYYYEALNIYLKNKNKQREAMLLGNISILQKSKLNAIKIKLQAKEIWDSLSPSHSDAIKNTSNLGIDYFDLAMDSTFKYTNKIDLLKNKNYWFANAEINYNNAVKLANESQNLEWYWMYAGNLSTLYKVKGDYKNAFFYLQESTRVHDSLYSQENKNKIAGIEGQREIDLKNKEIELKNIALSNQRKLRIVMAIALLLFGAIGVLLFRLNRIRKKSNSTLIVLNKELDNANRLKAKFFAILSHDLRAPVANMLSYLNIKQETPNHLSIEENSRFQKNIKTSAENLLANMDEVLLWSKGQMNNFLPDVKRVSANQIFTYLQSMFETEKIVNIIFNNSQNLELDTDENYLQTIMQNLTANAIKSTQHLTTPKIMWTAKYVNNKTTFTIIDNGQGIQQAQLNVLYENNFAPNAKTGFGLHLIKDLAKTINCKITANIVPSGGTSITLEL